MKTTIQSLLAPFLSFLRLESSSGLLLLGFAIIALLLANSPVGATYHTVLHVPLTVGFGAFSLTLDLLHWVNDALMAVFFFVIGLEVKREFLYGELRTISQMVLPVSAAIGGMIVPALLYAAVNWGEPTLAGWGIPMATDIAFALGIMTMAAKGAPLGLVVFLTALAIADDLGAIVVIAIFYTESPDFLLLAAGLSAIVVAFLLTRFTRAHLLLYLACGLVAWVAFLHAGIHPTIAGVLLGFAIPADESGASMLHRLEHAVSPWSAYVIMPVFALANAGVTLSQEALAVTSPLFLGIAAGLIIGKPLGIFGTVTLLRKTLRVPYPGEARPVEALGAGMLGGIGFTMSIFIASLAFTDQALLSTAKLAILASSITAGALGALVMKLFARKA